MGFWEEKEEEEARLNRNSNGCFYLQHWKSKKIGNGNILALLDKIFSWKKKKSVFVYVIVLLFFHVKTKYCLEVQQYGVSRPSGLHKGCAGVEQTQADRRSVAERGVLSLESTIYCLCAKALLALTPSLRRMFPVVSESFEDKYALCPGRMCL